MKSTSVIQYCQVIALFAVIVFCSADIFGAKTKTVTTEYIYVIPANSSLEAAKNTALERARSKAIAEEFGLSVNSSTSTIIKNDSEKTTSEYIAMGGSSLRGEWIETIEEPVFDYIRHNDELAIKVTVKGKIRETEGSKVAFDVKLFRNEIAEVNESLNFNAGDILFMSFKAPTPGYLAVYLVDFDNQVYCLLPYRRQQDAIYRTDANKEYMLFSKKHADTKEKAYVDGLILDSTLEKEWNRIVTIFSPNKFYKSNDNETANKNGFKMPRSLSYKEFNRWLSDVLKHDTDLSIRETIITVSK